MNTLYFLVGGSMTLILMVEVVEPFDIFSLNLWAISSFNLVGNPGNIEVPPEMRILLQNYLLKLMSHFVIHLKTIYPHPSISSPAIEGFISISGAKNLSLPIFISCPSGSLNVFSWTVVSKESLLSTLISPETKQNFSLIYLTVSKSDVLLNAYPLMCKSLDK